MTRRSIDDTNALRRRRPGIEARSGASESCARPARSRVPSSPPVPEAAPPNARRRVLYARFDTSPCRTSTTGCIGSMRSTACRAGSGSAAGAAGSTWLGGAGETGLQRLGLGWRPRERVTRRGGRRDGFGIREERALRSGAGAPQGGARNRARRALPRPGGGGPVPASHPADRGGVRLGRGVVAARAPPEDAELSQHRVPRRGREDRRARGARRGGGAKRRDPGGDPGGIAPCRPLLRNAGRARGVPGREARARRA